MALRAYEGDEEWWLAESRAQRATRRYEYATSGLCTPEKENRRRPLSPVPHSFNSGKSGHAWHGHRPSLIQFH